MALDATARKANVMDSLKKYLVDSLKTASGIEITFDKRLSDPPIVQGHTVNRWVTIGIGPIVQEALSSVFVEMFCCTRNDTEGFRLAQLRDTVVGYLTDTDMTDGMKRIQFYRSVPPGGGDWTKIGAFVVQDIAESKDQEAPDGTKFVIITCRLRFGSKV